MYWIITMDQVMCYTLEMQEIERTDEIPAAKKLLYWLARRQMQASYQVITAR